MHFKYLLFTLLLTATVFKSYGGLYQVIRDTTRIPQTYKTINLKEVKIVDNTPAVQLKGDTVEYNAGKFKTKENAVVEDLLRKLPGVRLEKDGSITAQGETVQRILVDGKEFFAKDPTIATKNLPASIIDKVQILDKKSEMASFTGVNDGREIKTINLITKKNSKRGVFGNTGGGIGTQNRYEAGVNVNSLLDDKQFSLFLKGNNLNKSGFSGVELTRMAGENPNMFNNLPHAALAELSRMKGVYIDADPATLAELAHPVGLSDARYGGANFNNDWQNLQWRSSYFFNAFNTQNTFDYNKLYQLADTSYRYHQQGNNQQKLFNQRMDGSADWQIDTFNSIKLMPHIDIIRSDDHQRRTFRSYNLQQQQLNDGWADNSATSYQTSGTMDILFRHRFRKPGYTLILNVKPEIYNYDQTRHNNSTANTDSTIVISQQQQNNSQQRSLTTDVIFTVPLSTHTYLQIGEKIYYTKGKYDTKTFDQLEGKYDPETSDLLQTQQWQALTKLSWAGQWKKLQLTMGTGYLINDLSGNSASKDYRISQQFGTFTPEVIAEYKPDKQRKFKFKYSYNATIPGIQSLQALPDKSDPLYIRTGNPYLSSVRMHNWQLNYKHFDIRTGNELYALANVNYYNSQVTDSNFMDLKTGIQYSRPTIVKGNYNANFTIGKTVSINSSGSNISFELQGSRQFQTMINNGIANAIHSISLQPGFNINYYLGNKTSLYGKFNANWYNRKPQKSWLLNYSLDAMQVLPYRITFETSLEAYTTLGMPNGYNQTIILLNTGLQKELGKQFSLRADAKDILNKNAYLTRIIGNGYVEDRRNNALGQYFMLSVIYKFRYFKKIKT